jgi:hypothetical protein
MLKFLNSKFQYRISEMIVQQLICDDCKTVLLEKDATHLNDDKFPITNEEAKDLDKNHRGHQCHIEVVEKP